MKKFALLFIVITMLAGLTTFVSAASEPKTVDVTLNDTPATVVPGEAVVLKAICKRSGSSFDVAWTNAIEGQTVFDEETECYVSEAVFHQDKPGVYTISCDIIMCAGKSSTTFVSRVERTIEVTGSVTLKGAEIRDLTAKPVYCSDGSVACYDASGRIYSLWSDGTANLYGSIYFYFGADETSKTVNVTIYDKGIKYVYPLAVNR